MKKLFKAGMKALIAIIIGSIIGVVMYALICLGIYAYFTFFFIVITAGFYYLDKE